MANEAPERIWANPDAGYCTTVGESTYTTEYIRADLATLYSDAVAGGEPAAWRLEDRSRPGWFTYYDPEQEQPTGAEPLYVTPPELDQLRDRVKELDKALEWLIDAADSASWAANIGTMDNAIEAARRVREGVKV